jgi:thioesterase domain-containing protein
VHSLGGDGGGAFFYYRKLAQLLGPDQPSFGIRSPQEPYTCVETMAERYVQELLRFRPEGPYLLGGFCFGGIVAFEMARQLRARGQAVALLALLESVPPGRSRWKWDQRTARCFLRNLQSWVDDLVQRGPGELVDRVTRKARRVQKRLAAQLHIGAEPHAGAELSDLINLAEYPKDYMRYAQAHWQALQAYQPRPYPDRITLFRARKQPLLNLDPALGWGDLTSDSVAVNIIPGTHEKMLEEPHVEILAAELKACLVEAQANAATEPDDLQGDSEPDTTSPKRCSVVT